MRVSACDDCSQAPASFEREPWLRRENGAIDAATQMQRKRDCYLKHFEQRINYQEAQVMLQLVRKERDGAIPYRCLDIVATSESWSTVDRRRRSPSKTRELQLEERMKRHLRWRQ